MEPINPSTVVLGAANAEDTLDEHFLYLLTFTDKYMPNLVENQDLDLCKSWLVKLCSEEYFGPVSKRYRNTYLFNLLLGMQNGMLEGPFSKSPPTGILQNPDGLFGPKQPNVIIQCPGWLEEVIEGGDHKLDFAHHSKDGRVYLAAKEMQDGSGAFAYLSVTLSKDLQVGSGEGEGMLEDMMPGPAELGSLMSGKQTTPGVEELLSHRRTIPERNRLVRFYRDIVQSLTNELNGEGTASPIAERLIQTCADDLRASGAKPELWKMRDEEQRLQLLIHIREKVEGRLEVVKRREQTLDKLEQQLAPGAKPSDDKFDDEIWIEQCRNDFKDKNTELLLKNYPRCVAERFIELIIDERLKIFKKWRQINKDFCNECYDDTSLLVKEMIENYKKSRIEWETIVPVTKALRNRLHQIQEEERAKKEEENLRLKEQSAVIEEENRHMESLLLEIKKAQKNYDRDYQTSENLRKAIEKEQEQLQKIDTYMNASHEHDELDMIGVRRDIEKLQDEIRAQERKIQELKEIVKTRPASSK